MFSPFSYSAPSSYRIISFAKVLTLKGHKVTVFLPNYDRYSGFIIESKEVVDGFHLKHSFQVKTKKIAINMLPYMFSASLKGIAEKYDVVHILKPLPLTLPGYMQKYAFGTPTVQDIDDLDHVIMAAEKHPASSVWFMQQCEKLIPRFADHLVVSCSPLKTLYACLGLKSKITQIPNGVFVDDFTAERDNHLKQTLRLKDKVVIYVGSLNNEVQLHPLILAMQKIVAQRKDISCLIVGDGTAQKILKLQINTLGLDAYFAFTGKVPHLMVPRYLSLADLGFACFPKLDYFKYASNIKVFEYMASGVPAIVNSDGDMPMNVDFGRAGIVTEPDAQSLSESMLAVLSNEKLRRYLSSNSKAYVRNFDWTRLTDRLLETYHTISK